MSAFTKITPIDMGVERNKFLADGKALSSEVFTAVATNGAGTPSYGVYFEMTERDDKYLIIVHNSDSTDPYDVTIKAGNDKIFGSGKDLVLSDVVAGDINFIKVDSGKFKQVAENATVATLAGVSSVKDCVVILGETTDIKVAVLKMPA